MIGNLNPLDDSSVAAAIRAAWADSQAESLADRHEEGGYIVRHSDLSFGVHRWPRGERARISPPPLDLDNCYNGNRVVAAFHTHPNPSVDEAGNRWEQGPSESDRRWHERRGLRGFVVTGSSVFEIDAGGNVSVVGKREELF